MRRRVFAQIGHGELHFEGPHLAVLVFPRQKPKIVIARRQRDAGVIFHVALRELRGIFFVQLELDLVANPPSSFPCRSRIWPMKSRSVVDFGERSSAEPEIER